MPHLAFSHLSGPPTRGHKIGGRGRRPNIHRLLLPWRLIIAIVSTILFASREEMLPFLPRPHCYLSSDAGLITVVAPIGPPKSPAHIFSSFYGEAAQFPLAFLDGALPFCAFPFLQNHFLDDFSHVNMLAQFCELSKVMATYNHRKLFISKLIE